MSEQVNFVFWKDSLRLLSTGGMGTVCADRQEAVMNLFDQIAASVSNIGYLNQIYDNAQVELDDDNMQEITVLDHFYLRDIYLRHHGLDAAKDTLSYEPHGKPVGLAYARRDPEGPEPNFEQALLQLDQKLKELETEYKAQEKKLL